MESDMIIKKVSVIVLLELLEELYDKGVDYIDVHGRSITEDQDVLGVSFSKGYMDPECIENFESFDDGGAEEEKDNSEIKINLDSKNWDDLV